MVSLKGCGKRIRQWRKSKGLKLLELSDLIAVSQGSISDLENEKSYPSAQTIVNLYEYTDLNIIWMLTGNEVEHGGRPIPKKEKIKTYKVSKNIKEFMIKRE